MADNNCKSPSEPQMILAVIKRLGDNIATQSWIVLYIQNKSKAAMGGNHDGTHAYIYTLNTCIHMYIHVEHNYVYICIS